MTLQQAINRQSHRQIWIDYKEDLPELLLEAAAELWEECPNDFGIQLINDICIVFGGTNRVIWTFKYGFRIDRPYCTAQFIDHYDKLMEHNI